MTFKFAIGDAVVIDDLKSSKPQACLVVARGLCPTYGPLYHVFVYFGAGMGALTPDVPEDELSAAPEAEARETVKARTRGPTVADVTVVAGDLESLADISLRVAKARLDVAEASAQRQKAAGAEAPDRWKPSLWDQGPAPRDGEEGSPDAAFMRRFAERSFHERARIIERIEARKRAGLPGIFVFDIRERVALKDSGETGTVVARSENAEGEDMYLLRYVDAGGRQMECWWGASALIQAGLSGAPAAEAATSAAG